MDVNWPYSAIIWLNITQNWAQSQAAVITVVNLGLLSFWTLSSVLYSEKNDEQGTEILS
jgi:hypothetical protein